MRRDPIPEHDTATTRVIRRGEILYRARCSCGWRHDVHRAFHRHTLVDRLVHLGAVGALVELEPEASEQPR